MKKYWLFYGYNYYPCGGMDDLVFAADTLEECKARYNQEFTKGFDKSIRSEKEYKESKRKLTWAHIYDAEQMKIVWKANEVRTQSE